MKTQRVRIYCLVAPDGTWNAGGCGYGYMHVMRDAIMRQVEQGMPGDCKLEDCRGVWIEADVPVPETTAIQGEVVDG